jgi:ABC-type nickel/cobalt efflux system permease component RcnA
MTAREDMVIGADAAANDVGHIVMSAVTIVLILAQIGLAAAALGTRYSLATAKIVLLFGAWMLWMALLVVVLWQRLNVGKPAQGLQPSGLGEQSSGRPGWSQEHTAGRTNERDAHVGCVLAWVDRLRPDEPTLASSCP